MNTTTQTTMKYVGWAKLPSYCYRNQAAMYVADDGVTHYAAFPQQQCYPHDTALLKWMRLADVEIVDRPRLAPATLLVYEDDGKLNANYDHQDHEPYPEDNPMSTNAPKTRNARAPRTKAKAAAPEKTVPTIPPVHTRWSTMFAVLSKGRKVELRTLARIEAWEWFRSKGNATKVTMTNRSEGLLVAGVIISKCGNVLVGILKGGRSKPYAAVKEVITTGYKDSTPPPDMTPMSMDDNRNTRWDKTRRSFTLEQWSAMCWDERDNWVDLAYEACACGSINLPDYDDYSDHPESLAPYVPDITDVGSYPF